MPNDMYSGVRREENERRKKTSSFSSYSIWYIIRQLFILVQFYVQYAEIVHPNSDVSALVILVAIQPA